MPRIGSRRSPISGRPTTSKRTSPSPTVASSTCSAGQGARSARCRRKATHAGRGPVVVRVDRAVPPVEDAVRRRGREGTVVEQMAGDRERRRASRSTSRSTSRRPFRRGERQAARGGESCARRAGRGRVDGWPTLRATVAGDGDRGGSVTRASHRRRCGAGAAPGVRRLGTFRVTPGSWRCSRADGASVTSSTRTATTSCRPTTRVPLRRRRDLIPAWVVDVLVAPSAPAPGARTSRS